MSYERMWDPEPPTPAELLEAQIKTDGGVIVRSIDDMPSGSHWAILRYGIFRDANAIPVTYVAYKDKTLWQAEVRRLAVAQQRFTAIHAVPASAKVTVSVDVEVDGDRT